MYECKFSIRFSFRAERMCRLCERQTRSGGLCGRPEKMQDVCYSWWCLSALSILGRLHWIDGAALSRFILYCQARPLPRCVLLAVSIVLLFLHELAHEGFRWFFSLLAHVVQAISSGRLQTTCASPVPPASCSAAKQWSVH